MKGFFVTGTDTGVGKTIISGGIAAVLKEKKMDIGVFKPMLSGISRKHPESDTSLLKDLSQTCMTHEEITPFAFQEPVAPYIAAKQEGKHVSMDDVLSHWETIRAKHDYFIVEGAGGIAAPLGETFLVSDVIQALQLPMILVARPDLGTINHTFLTVQYAQNAGLDIAGIVINGRSAHPDLAESTNPEIMEKLTGFPVLGSTPKLKEITKDRLQHMVKEYIDLAFLIKQLEVEHE